MSDDGRDQIVVASGPIYGDKVEIFDVESGEWILGRSLFDFQKKYSSPSIIAFFRSRSTLFIRWSRNDFFSR